MYDPEAGECLIVALRTVRVVQSPFQSLAQQHSNLGGQFCCPKPSTTDILASHFSRGFIDVLAEA